MADPENQTVAIELERRVLPELLHALHDRRLTQTNGTCDMAALDRAYESVRAHVEGGSNGE